jgi:hypothetical protein
MINENASRHQNRTPEGTNWLQAIDGSLFPGYTRVVDRNEVKETKPKMAELVLVSTRQGPLRPLVEAALANELRLLEAGIRRTERRLREFEKVHHMSTAEFVRRFEDDEWDETLERAEWVGEYRMLQRLQEKADTLRGVRFAN